MTWQERHRIVDGVKLFCWEAGSGLPLLVLHGVDGGEGVLPFHDGLAERFRVLAPSLPGFGRTELPAWMDSVDDLAYFLLDLLEDLEGNIDVLGIGFGGWVAAEMAV
ncbi:MAG: alpha/beta hydrolase, partial [Dehalococcoidia bacterium]|nr:alpha/beta hydrolase [Dehalococcoidia bacterium]